MAKETQNIPAGHITLKEAAQISGYAPDYIGQLIRKGKLYGRQVYFNVAWVTTEEAIVDYISAEKPNVKEDAVGSYFQRMQNKFLSETRLMGLFKGFLYIGIVVSVLLIFVLFYILSVNIDRTLNERALQRLENSEKAGLRIPK